MNSKKIENLTKSNYRLMATIGNETMLVSHHIDDFPEECENGVVREWCVLYHTDGEQYCHTREWLADNEIENAMRNHQNDLRKWVKELLHS